MSKRILRDIGTEPFKPHKTGTDRGAKTGYEGNPYSYILQRTAILITGITSLSSVVSVTQFRKSVTWAPTGLWASFFVVVSAGADGDAVKVAMDVGLQAASWRRASRNSLSPVATPAKCTALDGLSLCWKFASHCFWILPVALLTCCCLSEWSCHPLRNSDLC